MHRMKIVVVGWDDSKSWTKGFSKRDLLGRFIGLGLLRKDAKVLVDLVKKREKLEIPLTDKLNFETIRHPLEAMGAILKVIEAA